MESTNKKNVLFELRRHLGISGIEIAKSLNISFQAYYRYENNLRRPNDIIAYKLIHFFKSKRKKLTMEQLRPEKMK